MKKWGRRTRPHFSKKFFRAPRGMTADAVRLLRMPGVIQVIRQTPDTRIKKTAIFKKNFPHSARCDGFAVRLAQSASNQQKKSPCKRARGQVRNAKIVAERNGHKTEKDNTQRYEKRIYFVYSFAKKFRLTPNDSG